MHEEILPSGLLAILYKKANGEPLSTTEEALLISWIANSPHKEEFVRQLDNEDQVWEALRARYSFRMEGEWGKMEQRIGVNRSTPPAPVHRVHFLRKWGWAAAAILLLAGGAASLWLYERPAAPPAVSSATHKTAIEPGKEGAILTLADGRQLVLDSLDNGLVASQSGARVILQNGQLAYDHAGEMAGSTIYNVLSTPKGRQFTVLLPDGTKVWLNAASSLRFPTTFTGKERVVELQGEGYFEVAPHATQPFLVHVGEQVTIHQQATAKPAGTSFNIDAYQDEPGIRATVVEGNVSVSAGRSSMDDASAGKAMPVKPGQQAQVNSGYQPGRPEILVGKADLDKVLAWKNGFFNFENANLQTVMKQLERWYDIRVVYEKGAPDIYFVGKMSMKMKLDGVLKTLEESEVHFRMEEGRRLVVMP